MTTTTVSKEAMAATAKEAGGLWLEMLQRGARSALKATTKAMAPMAPVSGIRVARARARARAKACTSPAYKPWRLWRFLLWPFRRQLSLRDYSASACKHELEQVDLGKRSRHLRHKHPQLLCSNFTTSRESMNCCRCWRPCTKISTRRQKPAPRLKSFF